MTTQKINQLKGYFLGGKTNDIPGRLMALKKLKQVLKEHEAAIFDAAKKDFGRPAIEVFGAELATLYKEIDYACAHLATWTKPRKVSSEFCGLMGSSYVYQEPYGVVLILAPWNFPFLLTLLPLVHAVAAGNCVLVKPSEFAPAQAAVLERIVNKSFDLEHVTVMQGDAQVAQELLTLAWDYIFFTGSSRVGALVYQEAAKRLIPVTLELGGKNPTIVTSDADIEYAAQKIVWGKFFNAGQCCLAPDYVLVDVTREEQLLAALKKQIIAMYGQDPRTSPDYARIVNEAHVLRLQKLLAEGTPVIGGEIDSATRFVAPTILTDVRLDSSIMREEIFGPLLPIIPYKTLDEAVAIVKQKPKPLALYLFSSRADTQEKIIQAIPAGGGCINDVLMHHNSTQLPFGGVGASGIGAYHGKYGFDTFSHQKAIFKSSRWFGYFTQPPYKNGTLSFLKWWYR